MEVGELLTMIGPHFGKPLLERGRSVFEFPADESLFEPLQQLLDRSVIRSQLQEFCACREPEVSSFVAIASSQPLENEVARNGMAPEFGGGKQSQCAVPTGG